MEIFINVAYSYLVLMIVGTGFMYVYNMDRLSSSRKICYLSLPALLSCRFSIHRPLCLAVLHN